ncbi:MAG TPA: DUF1549 and DUF1553 domain-containing protein [Blastocatellia bacterium]|nr:DUF1549 and DUF1553 domain-containing protein [Blastocatellia bacterium]HMZ17849.1 DUF1549 and DUF1553 domain-containing protein [Blastocatellia bacterium]
MKSVCKRIALLCFVFALWMLCKLPGAVWLNSVSAKVDGNLAHWAFIAPVRPVLPNVKNSARVSSPVDRFILAALEKQGLTLSPEADRATLIRRLSLDLTGLPPTLKEIDNFLADTSPNAYEKLVDRLLASPHYGERWGRWWLDAARYADTNGFEKDRDRSIWPYRDWVIRSFNADKPFDQFTIEQIAGDLLPNATVEQRVATGFLRNSMLNEEGAVDPEQFRVEGLIDRVDAIGKAFLGLTINCTQCHTHKFDPIKHEEYYRFYAFLNQDEEPEMEVPTPAESKKRDSLLARVAKLEDELSAKHSDLPQRMAAWEAQAKQQAGEWTVLENAEVIATNGVKFEELLDHSFIPRGDNPPTGVYYLTAKTQLKNITGIRLELMTDHTLPRTGPGRSTQGVAWLSEFVAETAPVSQADKLQPLKVAEATADFAAPNNPISLAIDGNLKSSWSIDAGPGLRNQDRRAVFALQTPLAGFDGGTLLKFSLSQKEFGGSAAERFEAPNIGRFRISVTTAPNPKADPLPTNVRRLLAVPVANRTPEQQREVFRYYRTTVPEFADTNNAIANLMKQWPYPATTLTVTPRPVPRETHIFKRGDWKRPGEAVTPGTPSFLHPFPATAPRNRLGLAQWLAAKENPLTARVIVNRVWQTYFGQGLVSSPEDFGTRCETPSHPELLDWLAVEFRDGETGRRGDGETGRQGDEAKSPTTNHQPPTTAPWSLKHIHKLIVMSATYRQSSHISPELLRADATNRLLARAPRLRVEAEAVRDIVLSAGGLLSLKIGGPSVFPPIPDGAMAVSFRSRTVWETSKSEDRYRRAMYTFWKRSVPYPSLSVFDAPNADMACTRRIRSNSPLQALTTLNDAAFLEAAQALAMRLWKEGGNDDAAKVRYGFRLCTGRLPDEFEQTRLLQLLQKEQGRFAGNTAAAVYVSSPDLNNLPANMDLHELASWTLVARVLLNLDETITKQ